MTAFRDFLDVPHRTGKPRTSGLTHVLDKGLSLANLESLVEGVGEYVDILKFGWGTAYITHGIRAKVAVCDENGIIACPGGTLFEIAAHQGRVKDYLTWLHQIGVRHVEVSNGARHAHRGQAALHTRVHRRGLHRAFRGRVEGPQPGGGRPRVGR
jgi:phosphosulfolactate synthase